MSLTRNQHKSVSHNKTDAGWLDGVTPLSGFNLNEKGRAMIGISLVSTLQDNIINNNFTYTYGLIQFPPVPVPVPPITPIVTTDANSSGNFF